MVAMVVHGTLFILVIIFCLLSSHVRAATNYSALFVFGDSYADTGNRDKNDPTLNTPWRPPYGITWPGYPYGRYSNGRVFTDYYASILGVKAPIPYRVINMALTTTNGSQNILESLGGGGVNFAYAGSGVFQLLDPRFPNISTQIDELEQLLAKGVVSKGLISSSVALLVVAGNDYAGFLQSNPITQLPLFIPKVVEGMIAALERLHGLGFMSLAVSNLEPVGCLPQQTASTNYTACNETDNALLSIPHNTLLGTEVTALQLKLLLQAKISLLDFYIAFDSVIYGIRLPLRPCCEGINGANCGDTSSNGTLLYIVCSSPESRLFWDQSHPTNRGWANITQVLFPIT